MEIDNGESEQVGQQENGRRGKARASNLRSGLVLKVLLPALILAMTSYGQGQQPPAQASAAPDNGLPQPLTNKERWKRFVDETFRPPWPYVFTLGGGVVFQAIDYPSEWGRGLRGFGLRSASQFGVFAAQNAIHDGGEAALRYEPRYIPCRGKGFWRRAGHAVEMTFLTYNESGQKRPDLPQFASAYGSGVLSVLWSPQRFSLRVQGIQAGNLQYGYMMGTHLYEEFRAEIQRIWPFRVVFKPSPGKSQ